MNTATTLQQQTETVQRRLRCQATVRPDARACTHLLRGEHEGESYTYAELDRRARALAAYFQAAGARGDRALLIFDGGLDPLAAFFGCLYAGVIALPVPAPDPSKAHRYLPRLEAIVRDAGAKHIVTTSQMLAQLRTALEKHPESRSMQWVLVDAIDLADAGNWRDEPTDPDAIAYLQYTSGSTSTPKGVMVSHRNLATICEYNGRMLDFRSEGAAVCWMPYFHDFGLIEGMLMPVWHGIPVSIMQPMEFVQKPIRWLRAIHASRATNSSGPNFAFALCVRKTTPEQRAELDLSCWRAAGCAAEPISSRTVESFLEAFRASGFRPSSFYPSWGLAEATLLITGRSGPTQYTLDAGELQQNRVQIAAPGRPARTFVGCGTIAADDPAIAIRIVDPETCVPSAPGQIGEIWVAGGLLTKGYWQRPAETAETFEARIAGSDGGPYLRTGDLGFMAGRELVFTGRRKDLIIVEGRNHYPQDLEKTAEQSHPAVRQGCTVAFSVDADSEERVVIVAEISGEYSLSPAVDPDDHRRWVPAAEVVKAVRREIAEEHGVAVSQVVFVRPGGIHKTSSGKLQRSACRASYLAGLLNVAA